MQWIRRMRERLAPPGSARAQLVSAVLGPSPAERRARFEREHRFAEAEERRQMEKTVRDLAAGMDDEQFLMLILSSIEHPVIDGIRMPGFPTDQVQRTFVGSAKETALREGFTFYRCVKQYCRSLGAPIGGKTRILDFGCGWGRMARFFFKDVDCENILGVDVAPDMIAFCRAEMTCGEYRQIDPLPPLGFLEDRSLDVVFAYSVFTHLAEATARAWVAEFARVLRPGGIFLATTQRRSFLDFCESLRGKGDSRENPWCRSLARSFLPVAKAKEEYDSGKFLFSDGGGFYGDNPHYGEALIPKSYIEREYSRYLILRDFLDDPARLPQALFVMQKPDG
jgi:SAM-dependent methyltransferase